MNYLPDEDEKQMSKSTELNAHIIPFMVSTYVKLPNDHKIQNFCYDIDGKEFLNKWFDFLFEYSEKVCNANKNMYREVIQKLSEEARSMSSSSVSKLTQFLKILDKTYQSSNVIGFNSGKFDMNLVLSNFNTNR